MVENLGQQLFTLYSPEGDTRTFGGNLKIYSNMCKNMPKIILENAMNILEKSWKSPGKKFRWAGTHHANAREIVFIEVVSHQQVSCPGSHHFLG